MYSCVQRPYLDIFMAPGSPCHELTSSDNSTSMRIWLGRKESQCEGILPVSLHRWHCKQHHYLSSSSSTPSVAHYEMWNKRKLMRCSFAPWNTEKHRIKISKKSLNCNFFLLSIYLYMVLDIFKVSNQTPPPHTCWDLTRIKQGEKKDYTPFFAESKYKVSIRGLAQLVDEKSN